MDRHPDLSMIAVIMVDVWKTTLHALLLAGRTADLRRTYEAARVDGISVKVFFRVRAVDPARRDVAVSPRARCVRIFDLILCATSKRRTRFDVGLSGSSVDSRRLVTDLA